MFLVPEAGVELGDILGVVLHLADGLEQFGRDLDIQRGQFVLLAVAVGDDPLIDVVVPYDHGYFELSDFRLNSCS
jgi:hypothetical protein